MSRGDRATHPRARSVPRLSEAERQRTGFGSSPDGGRGWGESLHPWSLATTRVERIAPPPSQTPRFTAMDLVATKPVFHRQNKGFSGKRAAPEEVFQFWHGDCRFISVAERSDAEHRGCRQVGFRGATAWGEPGVLSTGGDVLRPPYGCQSEGLLWPRDSMTFWKESAPCTSATEVPRTEGAAGI
jgi:hypothetical protein